MACNGLAQSYIIPQAAPASGAANRGATWQDGISWSLQWRGKKKNSSQQTDGAHRNGSYMETTKGITGTTNTLLSALSKLSHTSLVGGKDRPKFRCLLSQEKGILFFKFIAPQTVWKRLESQRPTEQCLSLSIKTAKNKTQGLTVLETGHLQRDVNVAVPPSHGLWSWKAKTCWLKACN